MVRNDYKNYKFKDCKFESIVSPQVGLYPLTDEQMTYIPNLSTARNYYCNFPYNNLIFNEITVYPLGSSGYIARDTVTNSSTGQSFLIWSFTDFVSPWSSTAIKNYLNSENEIKDMQRSGFNVKQTGRWHKRLDNCTIIRTRYFSPPPVSGDYRVQYTFDSVIYDNGIIELRYQSLDESLTRKGYVAEYDATTISIGISSASEAPNDGRYIDFSRINLLNQDLNLGTNKTASSLPYSDATLQWPGQADCGAIYRLVPPAMQIKKVLPRRLLRRQDNNSTVSKPGMYDDRKTVSYTNQRITMPTRMPTLYGQLSTVGTSEYQINSDIYMNGVVDQSAINQWIDYANGFQQNSLEPFSELSHLEENLKSTNFYLTGTSVEDVGTGFEQSLDHKVKISYDLIVNNQFELSSSTASLVYYDARSKGFALSGELEGFNAYINAFGDAKLYSAFGTPVAGGTDGTYGPYKTTTQEYEAPLFQDAYYDFESLMRIVNKTNVNLSGSHSFSAAKFNTYSGSNVVGILPLMFSNNLNKPFLLEKTIIEMPFCAGPGWLNDTTKAQYDVQKPFGGSFDDWKYTNEGGPCVTVGLIRENNEGKIGNFKYQDGKDPNFSYREVICSGTMIPVKDSINGHHFVYDNKAIGTYDVTLVLSGFNVYSGNPSAIVTKNNGNYFTGSVEFTMTPQVVNCIYYRKNESLIDNDVYRNITLNDDDIDLQTPFQPGRIANYKPLGPSGLDQVKDNRQIFGINNSSVDYKFVVESGQTYRKLLVKNPIKHLSGTLSASYAAIKNANPSVTFTPDNLNTQFVGLLKKSTTSPYMLYPGDKLTVFVSKYHASQDERKILNMANPTFAASISQPVLKHDIKINTGTIKVTLYGSYVSSKVGYSPPIEEPSTNVITRIIGNDPVLDQFEMYSDVELMGTYTDNIVLPMSGALMSGKLYVDENPGKINARDVFVSGSIGRMRVSSATFGKLSISDDELGDTQSLVRN